MIDRSVVARIIGQYVARAGLTLVDNEISLDVREHPHNDDVHVRLTFTLRPKGRAGASRC